MYCHRITVKTAVDTRSSTTGEVTQTYTPLDTVSPARWAKIVPTGGAETINADTIVSRSTYAVYMRWDRKMAAATPKMVIDYGSRRFQIDNINDTHERRIELVFSCQELTT